MSARQTDKHLLHAGRIPVGGSGMMFVDTARCFVVAIGGIGAGPGNGRGGGVGESFCPPRENEADDEVRIRLLVT